MKHLLILLGGMLALLTPTPTLANDVILKYAFYYGATRVATVTDKLHITSDQQGYTINSHIAAEGIAALLYGDIIRKSEGLLDAQQGLQSTLYFQDRRGKQQQATYDPDTKLLTLQREGETKTVPVAEQLFDFLTAIYQSHIQKEVISGQMHYTNGWRSSVYEFKQGEAATITTPLGDVNAIPIERHSKRGKRIFWISPTHQFLMIKSEVEDKGHLFTTILEDIQFIDKAE